MKQYNLMYAADFYKVSHKNQYPEGIESVHSTLVARNVNYNDIIDQEEFFWFGTSLFMDKLSQFSSWFFNLSPETVQVVLGRYKKFLDTRLGGDNDVSHWHDLYLLGYLPLTIKAAPERTVQRLQTPLLLVENTSSDFYWLTSFIETTCLANIWPVTTAANRAWNIRNTIEKHFVNHTEEEKAIIDFMAHDFSYRGQVGDDAAELTGCGHLSVFKGSDTIPAILRMEEVYGETTGFSVPATEHSVMCAGGQDDELTTYRRILSLYSEGIVSIVSDTWDYFKVLSETLPTLKEEIMSREGKLVIRPDSGNPIDIICGDADAEEGSLENLGSLRILDGIFGHTLDSTGLKVLDSHIGLIYGDGMTQERIDQMLTRMVSMGYSPLNIVFGVGAYTYQFMTRDELGFAFKATAVKVNGEWRDIQKNPKTDSGKKSLTGRFNGEGMEVLLGGTT